MRRLFILLAILLSVAVVKAQENGPKPIKLTQEEQQLVQKNNDFAFRLFRQARTDESLLLSPLSITFVLGMLNNGADGITREEIDAVLGSKDVGGAEVINSFCRKLLDGCGDLDKETKVSIANNIYMNKPFELKKVFGEKAFKYYDAQPESRDFADGKTRDVINQWCSDHTEGMIKEVLKENEFNPQAVSYLLNALYFKGMWTQKFDPSMTQRTYFNEEKAMVEMMQMMDGKFSYTSNDLYQSIILPYGNGTYQMTVFLPQYGKTLDDVVAQLNGKSWNTSDYRDYNISYLAFPRFETSTDLQLEDIMKALGMPNAFEGGYGFNEFCDGNMFIGMMKQVAKIKLDEEGTEASAVTVIEMDKTVGSLPDAKFVADRPFLYTISERSTGIIFFIGQYMGDETAEVKGEEVAVKEVKSEKVKRERIYNLSGQRLLTPPAKGLYITDGRLRYRPQ